MPRLVSGFSLPVAISFLSQLVVVALSVPGSLVAFLVVSPLGQHVVVALSVLDSLVAFLAVAFLVQFVVCVLGAVQGFLAISSDDHSHVLPCNPTSCRSGLSF